MHEDFSLEPAPAQLDSDGPALGRAEELSPASLPPSSAALRLYERRVKAQRAPLMRPHETAHVGNAARLLRNRGNLRFRRLYESRDYSPLLAFAAVVTILLLVRLHAWPFSYFLGSRG